MLYVCLEDKDSEVSLFICVLPQVSLWPCARREVADPSLSTGEQEKRPPLGAGEAFLLESIRHPIPRLPETIHNREEKKPTTKQSHAKVQ